MARPRKTLTIDEALGISTPVVYGLASNDDIFYVGRTKNLSKRLQAYINPERCHNQDLASHLKSLDVFDVIILDDNPKDIRASEKQFIEQYKGSTFNKISVEYDSWLQHTAKPWHAGSGIRCPSDFLMWRSAKEQGVKVAEVFAEVLQEREAMTTAQRVAFEVSVYRDAHPAIKEKLSNWFCLTCTRMLEAANG